MKKSILMVLVIIILVGAIGVLVSADNSDYTIAFSQSASRNPWRAANTNDMEYWAKKLGINYIWADGDNDAANQLADCEDLIAQKPDLLIMAPLEAEALNPVAKMCAEANIPLIVIDRSIVDEPGTGTYICNITSDFVETGRKTAQSIAKYLKEKNGEYAGNVVEITGTPGASVANDMAKGFREVLDQYPEIKIIASQTGDFQETEGKAVMENFLQAYPKGEIDAVFGHNDPIAKGALLAVKEANRDELIGAIWGMDAMQFMLKGILDGEYGGSVANSPFFGKITFETALRYLKGETVERYNLINQKLFDKYNLDDVRKEYNRQVAENSMF